MVVSCSKAAAVSEGRAGGADWEDMASCLKVAGGRISCWKEGDSFSVERGGDVPGATAVGVSTSCFTGLFVVDAIREN